MSAREQLCWRVYATELGTRLAFPSCRAGMLHRCRHPWPGAPWNHLSLLCRHLPHQHMLCPHADSRHRSRTGGFQEIKTKWENQLVRAKNSVFLAGLMGAVLGVTIFLAPSAERLSFPAALRLTEAFAPLTPSCGTIPAVRHTAAIPSGVGSHSSVSDNKICALKS